MDCNVTKSSVALWGNSLVDLTITATKIVAIGPDNLEVNWLCKSLPVRVFFFLHHDGGEIVGAGGEIVIISKTTIGRDVHDTILVVQKTGLPNRQTVLLEVEVEGTTISVAFFKTIGCAVVQTRHVIAN